MLIVLFVENFWGWVVGLLVVVFVVIVVIGCLNGWVLL